MPSFTSPDPFRFPAEVPIDYWDGGHNPHGGGTNPYSPGTGFNMGGFGGGGGGGWQAPSNYRSFTGYGDPRQRKAQMGAGPSAMSSSWLPNPGDYMNPSHGPGPAPASGGGGGSGFVPGSGWTNGGDYQDQLGDRFGASGGPVHAGGTDLEAMLDLVIGGHGRGMWGPEGDPRINQAYEQDANRRGMAMENSAVMGADFDGADPWTRGLARTLARNSASAGRWGFYNQNKLNNAQRYADLFDFATKHKVGEYDAQKQQQWSQNAADAQRKHENSLFPWELGGQLAGSAIGALSGKKKGSG